MVLRRAIAVASLALISMLGKVAAGPIDSMAAAAQRESDGQLAYFAPLQTLAIPKVCSASQAYCNPLRIAYVEPLHMMKN